MIQQLLYQRDVSSLPVRMIAKSLSERVRTNWFLNSDSLRSLVEKQIRRRISILERPLVTARNDGKSYIYSNFNPKYAQYAVTILRTYYNFCVTKKFGKKKLTPAQRLGIADRHYEWKDIIYFR